MTDEREKRITTQPPSGGEPVLALALSKVEGSVSKGLEPAPDLIRGEGGSKAKAVFACKDNKGAAVNRGESHESQKKDHTHR